MLSPAQIGQIAAHIKVSLELNPLELPDKDAVCELAPDNFMESWERCLETAIDKDSSLPSYHEIHNHALLDALISHYSEAHDNV